MRPSCRTEGWSEDACCSFPAGPSVGGGRRRTTRWPIYGSRLSDAGREGSPTLSSSMASVRHVNDGAMERQRMEGKLRRTPTWRAKCRMWGSDNPLRFEHWGVRGVSPSYRSML